MAGRRRTGALAGAAELATSLIHERMQERQKLQAQAVELYQRFQLEDALAQRREQASERKEARAALEARALQERQGQQALERTLLAGQIAASKPERAPSAREQVALELIKAPEQRRQAAPSSAMTGRLNAPFQPSALVSDAVVSEHPSAMGRAKAIARAPMLAVDERVGQLRAMLGMIDPVAQRQAAEDARFFGTDGSASAVTDEDLDELTTAITHGLVTTRAQAEQVIQAAGLDPSDPAFQAILDALP